jgi:hypothetical protein
MKLVPGCRIVLAFLLAMPSALLAQHEHPDPSGDPPEKLGKVHFETSCGEAAQPQFDRAVALLHSFWFSASIGAFQKVLETEPGCGMAYWGLAMSYWSNPFGGIRSAQALETGAAAAAKGRSVGAKTQRERDYIDAVSELYKDYATVDQRTRTLAYEKAMEKLTTTYPEDREGQAYYALALDQNALPTDKTYANQLKAAAILERLFKDQPDHPGLAHYIIHSYDVPALAPRALEAARRYAQIAPSAPHALHMPSHTFTRVGSWQESIDTNIASAAAARKDHAVSEELHALDYQVYAYLQTAQDGAARGVVDELPALAAKLDTDAPGAAAPGPAGIYALETIPARYSLERGDWAAAAALVPRENKVLDRGAMSHFARALGAARSGNLDEARKDIDDLAAIRDRAKEQKDVYWSGQAEIQRRAASAWVAYAEGKSAEALDLLRSAVEMEDATEKSAVTPGPLAPAGELLGEMLLASDQPGPALGAFEATLRKEPHRFRSTYGAAKAAELTNDRGKASRYYGALVSVCERGDAHGRKELDEARAYLNKP